MTASEKLKILEAAKVEGHPAHAAVLTLMDALPQIVAVVEAAERLVDPVLEPRAHIDEALVLDGALSALDEALGETDRSNPA